jgi:NAD(P)-dependent dehydrogenase (short-subunit alcohol dehydrogenase family)
MPQITFDHSILSQSANKTVLITGAARGIGAATAALFNHHGANVVIADLAQFQDAAEHLISSFTHPQRALFVPGNIVDWVQLTSCFKAAIARFGGIDVVVANAGIMESSPVLDMNFVDENGDLKESAEAVKVIDVNLKGTLNSMVAYSKLALSLKLQVVY